MAAIAAFADDHGMTVTRMNDANDPYGDEGSRMETYADDRGREYWLDPRSDRVIQMGPAQGGDPSPLQDRTTEPLSVHELRDIAIDVAELHRSGFIARLRTLHPLEDNTRRRQYFFRWDDFAAPCEEDAVPPFLQVALRPDGSLVSFTDTLGEMRPW
jgi:hypothetical protein